MTTTLFGKATTAIIVFTASGFLAAYACGVAATPSRMAPWSALSFVIVGCTLWASSNPGTKKFGLHRLGAILVFAIGAIMCGEHLLSMGSTTFDRFLFPSLLPQNSPLPGRPAWLAGSRYCLLGMMLFLLQTRRRTLVLAREWIAVTIITLCYFGFVAVLSSWGTNAPQSISPYAALLGIVAAIHVLATGKEGLLLPLLRDTGPAGMIARSLMPLALIVPAVSLSMRQLLTNVPVDDSRRPDGILFASLNILAALAIVWISASKLRSIDLQRREAAEDVRRSRDNLDQRVRLRTRELVEANERLAVEASNREAAQNELRQINAVLSSLIEACPLAIIAFNLDGTVRRSNNAADAMGLRDNQDCRLLAGRAGTGERVEARELVYENAAKTVHLHVWASPILTHGVRLDGVVMMAADVSESKALEAHIQQNQRLESLGVLAGGIAHDFNNLLTGVIGNASFLQGRFLPESREARAVADLISAGQVMAKLTSQMLAYSGRSSFLIQDLDLSSEVRHIGNLLQASIPKNVRLNLALAEDLPSIEGDSSQIQQVVMNLAVNGAEALGLQQGAVEVRTFARHADAGELSAGVTQPPAPPGEYVVLEVRDNGVGIDEKTVTRIFDPFFTTKFAGRGMGLSAVLGIVRSHHGALIVQSSPGAGSVFRVYFPGSPARIHDAPAEPPESYRGTGTILLVDDEAMVVRMAQTALEEAGFDVLSASNGGEALNIYAANRGRIDAVVLDVTMPIMGGEEVMEHFARRWPDATVILTSGYDLEEAQHRFALSPAGFLQKPYTVPQLTSAVALAVRSRARIF
jgi:signal transduction histidine kinase/CheY-like chemotaxis protein